MARFGKQHYLNKTTKEVKIFSYTLAIPKRIVEEAKLQDSKVDFSVRSGKIIIEKALDKSQRIKYNKNVK